MTVAESPADALRFWKKGRIILFDSQQQQKTQYRAIRLYLQNGYILVDFKADTQVTLILKYFQTGYGTGIRVFLYW